MASSRQDLGLPAEPVVADREASVAEHVRAVLDARTRALVAHAPGTRLGADPEELHRVRVAVRRMRAVLRVARPHLDRSWSEPLRAELGWLGRALGPARDLDVLLQHLRAETTDLPPGDRAAADRLVAGVEAERRTARSALREALDSRRYADLLRALAAAVRTAPDRSDVDSRRQLRELVLGQVRQLREAGDRLPPDPSDRDLHALRITGKRVRYAAELAQPALGDPARRLVAEARRLQDVLGAHQDACVAVERLRGLLRDDTDPQVAFVAGRLVEREHHRRTELRARWPVVWESLRQAAEAV